MGNRQQARRGLGAVVAGLALLSALAGCGPRMGGPAPLVTGAPSGSGAPAEPPAQIRVQPGDTVYGLARTYGVSMSAIIAANHFEPPYRLAIGETVLIPRAPAAEPPVEVAALPPREQASASPVPQPPVRLAALPPEPAPPRPAGTAEEVRPPPAASPAAAPMPEVKPPPGRSLAKPAKPAAPPPGAHFLWPVRGRVIAGFGSGPQGTKNEGINIAAPRGAPVEATAGGVVAYAGNELRGYGNLILIRHQDGWISAYAHLDAILVKRGQRVSRGAVIGRVGATGSVSAPQLHFELRQADRAVDPLKYLPPSSTAAAPAQPRRG